MPSTTFSRNRILESASRLFHTQGIAATSLDQILTDSGTGKGQFYHFFGSKQGVVDAVLAKHAEDKVGRIEACLAGRSGVEGVRLWLELTLEDNVSVGLLGGCPIASMAAEAREGDTLFRDRLAEAFDAQLAVLSRAFREELDAGTLSPDTRSDALALRILAAVQGGLLLAATFKDPAPLEEACRSALRELEAAVATPRLA